MQSDHIVLKLPSEEVYDSVSAGFLDLFLMREMLSEDAHALTSKLLHETFKIFVGVRPASSAITIECTCGERKIKIAISDDFKKPLSEETSKRISELHPNVKVNKKSVVIESATS